MKNMIITVGTSILENFDKIKNNSGFSQNLKYFKREPIDSKSIHRDLSKLKAIEQHINNISNNLSLSELFTYSAELKSLEKLKSMFKEEINLYLFCSDTALGKVVGDFYKKTIPKLSKLTERLSGVYLKDCKIIEDLQVWNSEKFKKGMVNLVKEMLAIFEITGRGEDLILNITGGFKAIIPYLTVFGQINGCHTYYIFEDTDNLIHIPPLPIDVSEKLFEKYWEEFEKVTHPNVAYRSELSKSFLKDCIALLEECRENDTETKEECKKSDTKTEDYKIYVSTNVLGEILFNRYKSKYFVYYSPDEVEEKIRTQQNISRILQSKFHEYVKSGHKKEIKGNHCVYDDGNNSYRIFFFEKDGKVYVYNTFENHDKYLEYLNSTCLDDLLKEKIIKQSKPRTIIISKGGKP